MEQENPPEYGKGFYNSIVNMEDYPSLTSSYIIGLPILGLCCFGKILHLVAPHLSGYVWKTPLVFILLYTRFYAQNFLFWIPYLNSPQIQL